MDGPIDYRNRICPGCNVASVKLPLFTTRRRDPVTCTNCGARLERVLPGVPYYTISFVTALLLEISFPGVLLFALFKQWGWIAVIVATTVLVNLGVSMFLNRLTRVEYADIEDARRDKPGRWYPG